MKKFTQIISMLLLITLLFTACKGNPETPIIKNKDIENMLSVAENSDGKKMSDFIGKYDSYKKSFTDDSFNVTVNVDASVGIPKVDKMSVLRVKQQPFTQEFLDTVKSELIGNIRLYNGSALRTLTKKDLEREIGFLEDEIATLERDNPDEDQTNLKNTLKEIKDRYNSAPDTLDVSGSPCDGKIHSVSEMYNKNKKSDYYSWLNSLNPNGEFFYGVSDGKNGEFLSLSVNNSESQSNLLSFRKCYQGYQDVSGLTPNNELNLFHWGGTEIPSEYKGAYFKLDEDSLTISETDAIEKADGFMEKIGLSNDFSMTACEAYTENVDIKFISGAKDLMPCRTYYVVRYSRNINGATITENGNSKYSENWSGDSYSKQTWHQESIVLRINDNGIVGFDYVSPIEIVETVVDSSALQPFEEIQKQFERMVVISNASKEQHIDINVDRIEFGYTRISEKDNFSTGLLVPVWAFYGTNTNSFNKEAPGQIKENIMTINAIDGTIIDSVLGY